MNKQPVHDRNPKPRKFHGEAESAELLSWLNPKNPSYMKQHAIAKIERVMSLVSSLHDAAEKLTDQKPSKNFLRDQRELNEWLNEFVFVNGLYYEKASGLTWKQCNNDDALAKDSVKGETEAIARIIELSKMGMLARIRKCDCGKYFFVRFPNRQRFHEDECREKFWEASLARKKQKRQKSKEYYYLHKRKNIK